MKINFGNVVSALLPLLSSFECSNMPSSAFVSNREFITLFAGNGVTGPAVRGPRRSDIDLVKAKGRRQKQPENVWRWGSALFRGNRQVFGKVCPELLSLMNI